MDKTAIRTLEALSAGRVQAAKAAVELAERQLQAAQTALDAMRAELKLAQGAHAETLRLLGIEE